MKKILSILICVVLGISSAWADSTTDKKSITIKATASPASGGTVLVATKTATDGSSKSALFTSWNWNDFVSDPNGAGVTSQHTGKSRYYEWTYWTFGGNRTSSKTTGIYYRVNAYPNEGYYFQKWTGLVNVTGTTDEEGEEIVESTVNPYQPDGYTYLIHKKAKTYYYNDDKTHNITAYFRPVTIDKMQIDGEDVVSKTLNTTDKLSYKETTITFTVTGADNMNDFVSNQVVLSGDSRFTIQSSTLSGNTVTVVVRFKDDDRHVVDGTLPKATVTLTSKGDNSSTKTATITATSDLTPYFTVTPSPCDLTPNDPVEDGNEVSAILTTTATTGYTKVVSLASWNATFTDPVAAAQLGFSISNGTTNSPTVKFTPTPASINKANVTTEVCITSTYVDNSSPQKTLTDKQCVIISVDAGKVFTINTVSDAVMDFDIVDYSETNNPVDKTFPVYTTMELSDFTITENLNGITYVANVVGQGSAMDNIVVTAQSNHAPDTYVSTIDFAETGDDLHASLTVNVPIKLAKPVVTATVGLGQKIQLDWQDVYGATSYIVKSGETVLATIVPDGGVLESAYTVTNIAGRLLNTGFEYSFTVTAVYEPNAFGNRESDEVTAIPTAPYSITSPTDLDIYTGTDIFKSGDATYGVRPYRQKRQIDLTKAFDSNRTPLFDQLYIFGLTTNDDETMVTVDGVTSHKITGFTKTTNSNAVTPCYVYNKSGNTYVLDASKSVANVNVSTKPESFNIEAKGQKIYFTGYAPYASCGSTWEENGVFYFSGDGKDIDIYFDNLQLYARYKTVTGTLAGTKSYVIHSVENALNVALGTDFHIDWNGIIPKKVNVYAQGSGSALCFQSKSDFSPQIHLSGDNVLESVEGIFLNVDVEFASFTFKTDQPVVQKSAPIQIVNDEDSYAKTTKLVIDDLWGSERTNGSLNLASASVRNAPTIDLGNENTELHINGGRITLSNSFPSSTDGKYTVSFAISYRKYSMLQEMANMYGLGSDQPGGKVRFNDGTINCNPLKEEYFKNNAAAWDLYHNLTSMKCPQDTKIDGGTFNCDVLACSTTTSKGSSPKNTKGEALCKFEIPVNEVSTTGVVTELVDDWMNYAKSIGAKTNKLGDYGISSMTPETVMDKDDNPKQVVYMMLPSDDICFVDIQTTPWVMCYPQFTVNTSGQQTALGGPVDVPYSRSVDGEGLTTIIKTSKFFYGEMDPLYMVSSIEGYEAPGGMTVDLDKSGVPETVNNTSDYVVYDKMYMMIPVVANQWKMFVPPFDVSNVYVIESYPETKLIEDYGTEVTDKKGNLVMKIIDVNKIEDARTKQAYRYVDLFYSWVLEADVNKSTSDFWSNDKNYRPTGTYQSYGGFIKNWMDLYIEKNASGTITNKDYMPVIEQLYHYTSDPSAVYPTGKYWWDANFYLYKATNKVVDVENDQLQISWDEVPVVSKARNLAGNHNVIMKKGEVYVWSFPSTVVNNTMQDYTENWDYWTGKYILLEGYPTEEIDTDGDGMSDDMGQFIAGSDAVNSTILADINPNNKAEMRGNYTFAKANLDDVQNPFVLNNYYRGTSMDPDAAETSGWYGLLDDQLPHNIYVNADGYGVELTAGQGFILTNFTSPYGSRPRSINVKSGAVTYYDRDETTTSLPTIGGNNHMFVYNIAGGVGIVPVVEQQVSIYNAAGQLITSQYLTDEVHIPLPSGIYLITGANDQFKAVVK